MIVEAIPPEVDKAFRASIGLGPDAEARKWTVWALATRSLRRPEDAAQRVGYQFVPLDCQRHEVLEAPIAFQSGIHIVTGTMAAKVRSALEVVLEIDATEGQDASWELRSVRIPALYLEALWLHSLSRLQDIVVPYSSYDEDILEDQRYRLKTFLELAARAASHRSPSGTLIV
jgi:hypothetical protein